MGLSLKRFQSFCTVAVALLFFAGTAISQNASQAAPTVDEIIDHYISAIGGRAAIEKVASRVSLGNIDVPSMHLSGTVMIHEKAPNKILQVVVINGNAFRQGFDGENGWTDDPADGERTLSGAQLAESRRDADFYHPLHLHQIYSDLKYVGTEKLDDRDAYVLQGTPDGESEPDKMYFDPQTGLIVRLVSHSHTPDGESTVTEDFQDYRKVDGLQLPYTVVQKGGSADFTIRIGELRHDVSLEDSEFAPPQPGQSKVQ
jgi:zinc protease